MICPVSRSSLFFDSDNMTLENEKGYKFQVKNYIPVLLSDDNRGEFDYIEHYSRDAELFDYFEERTGGTEHDERRVREYVLSEIPRSALTVLDVGCGRGWIAEKLTSGKEIVCSLDISFKNTDKVLDKYPSENHAAVVADALHLPFRDSSFDCVVASEVIEHTKSPDLFIKELFRCVKPGGKLIITTPYKEEIRYYLCIHCNKPTPVNAHLHVFDEHKLRELYTENDLADFRWIAFGNKALMHLRMHVFLKYFPFKLWKLKDDIANLLINKRAHILAVYTKSNG